MNLAELQAELRHFAAERDWQPFHTPKNLSMALMVEAAELAEVFQWMTAEESCRAHEGPTTKQRVADEVADVFIYLLQLADHSEVNIEQAVRDKLARNGMKYPAKKRIARVASARASAPRTHVLVDYENVQPSDDELRAMVPDAGQVWVFHGPQQRQVEQRFVSLGADVTAVPIGKSGKNALDFCLSFYVGYIASRSPESAIVVVANDKGYEPMLECAKALGVVVQRLPHGQAKPAFKKATPKKKPTKKVAAKTATAQKAVAKKAVAAAPAARTVPGKEVGPAKKAVTKAAALPPAKKAAVVAPAGAAKAPASVGVAAEAAAVSSDFAATIKRLTDSLRKMGDKRPTKPASLRRSLKSFLGSGVNEESVEVTLARLIEDGVIKIDAVQGVSYPRFDAQSGSTVGRV